MSYDNPFNEPSPSRRDAWDYADWQREQTWVRRKEEERDDEEADRKEE